jgi:uncharacterized protein (DUF4415 family)
MKTKNKVRDDTSMIDPKKLKRMPRGTFLAKVGETESRNTKVRISILVDLDVLNFYKERAEQPGSLAYQTQINQVLRTHMDGKEASSADTLVQDERFIRAVAQRVRGLSSKKQRKSA